jgi:hypothetical protein
VSASVKDDVDARKDEMRVAVLALTSFVGVWHAAAYALVAREERKHRVNESRTGKMQHIHTRPRRCQETNMKAVAGCSTHQRKRHVAVRQWPALAEVFRVDDCDDPVFRHGY